MPQDEEAEGVRRLTGREMPEKPFDFDSNVTLHITTGRLPDTSGSSFWRRIELIERLKNENH